MTEWHYRQEPETIAVVYRRYRDFDLLVDSRRVSQPGETLFFALPGQRHDGHDFIASLLRMGVRHFVVERENYLTRKPQLEQSVDGQANFLVTEDVGGTLRELAAYHRRQFMLPVIAITGSNGKTIVKDWLAQLLARRFSVCASPRSYNSLIGVPLSVWQLRKHHEVAIFEAGISQPGDMIKLREVIQPTAGMITYLGTAHRQNFKDEIEHYQQKLTLFKEVDWLLLPATELEKLRAAKVSLPKVKPIWTWSVSERSETFRSEKNAKLESTTIVLEVDRSERIETSPEQAVDSVTFDFPDLPPPHLQNARSAAVAARLLGLSTEEIQVGLPSLLPLANRLEQRRGRDGGQVINDSYSNDFDALAAALDFAENQDPFNHICLILGTVQPIRDLPTKLKRLLQNRVNRLILVGSTNARLRQTFPTADYAENTETVLARLPLMNFSDQTVLIKGASYESFGRIADALSYQLHRTTLRIDLSALRHNLVRYRQHLPVGCRLMVMAKASAYGSGALPVARALVAAGADYLAVAYPEEGRQLRQGGVGLPIMVLNAEAYTFATCAAYDLEPVIHNQEDLLRATRRALTLHLELDTGMGRLGFSMEEFQQLDVPAAARIASIFTHLAASEAKEHDAFTEMQFERFDQAYQHWLAVGYSPVLRHALNSNGISRFSERSYDMVRLGIGLYGVGDAALAEELLPVLTLSATVTAVSDRPAGTSIGYGRRGQTQRASKIAVLSIGYADGLPRLAGEGNWSVRIAGRLAPTIGSICMDMCTVDVTGIEGLSIGSEAVIFSSDHPVELLAHAAKTIPYEVLTGIGERVSRIYVGE